MNNIAYILGVLDNGMAGLCSEAQQRIQQADVIIGATRTLTLFEHEYAPKARQHDLAEGLSQAPLWITQAHADNLQVVVLATGDPMCHGIGSYLLNKLPDGRCRVISNVSTAQLLFSRLGLAWQTANICSVHSKDAGEWSTDAGPEHGLYGILKTIRSSHLTAIFTSPDNSPDRIARMLLNVGIADRFTLSVGEALLTDQEKVIQSISIADAAQRQFSKTNVVILHQKVVPQVPLFGLADATFIQRKPDKGLITKREVRAVSLARLQLRTDSIVWDIGAGSGSVGLEAARLCNNGYVFAIEKNREDVAIAQQNRLQFGISNYRVQHGKAPDLLADWPAPDAIFFGGTGGELKKLIALCLSRLKTNGHLVMNFVTLENLALSTQTLKELSAEWEVTQLQASRSQPILNMQRLQAENPVWIVCAQRGRVKESAHE